MITFSQEVCMTIAHTTRPTSGCSCNRRSLNFELAELLFNYCSYCGCELLEMSTVGHGAFAVYKIRQNQDKMLTNIHSMEQEKDQIYNEQDNTLGPMKYSSKLMNSIWGMYNRYSVHNFKKNIDGSCVGIAANQQMQSVGSAASVDKTSTDIKAAKGPTQLFPNLWAPSDYSY